MQAVFSPSAACGTVAAPPSKSMAHRLLLCAGLAQGESLVHGVAFSQDVLATMECLRALGARLTVQGDAVRVIGMDVSAHGAVTLPCRESGSTLRFLLPLALLGGAEASFTAGTSLLARPMTVYEQLSAEKGLRFERSEGAITVAGPLRPGDYTVSGAVSSQFVSGLLFALPLLPGQSTLRLLPPVESRPYIALTLQALAQADIRVEQPQPDCFVIPGGQQYRAGEWRVEGDWSNAAAYDALNLCGGRVTVTGLAPDSLQGDRVYPTHFDRLRQGCCTVDLTDCPDLGPLLFVAAALLHGGVFTGAHRLRYKESDRIAAMTSALARCGVALQVTQDRVTVPGGCLRAPSQPLDGCSDHRIVMALAVLLSGLGGVLNGCEAVDKSCPDFWTQLRRLGVAVTLTK